MSGLFNMLMGRNPAAPYLLAVLGISNETAHNWPLGRLRDVYTNEDGTKVFIFTRNGGLSSKDEQVVSQNLKDKHPDYIGSVIDDFDSTYLTYEFKTPTEMIEITKQIADMTETEPPMVRFRRLLDDMQSGKKNESVDNALEVGKKIFGQIFDGKDGIVEHDKGSVEIRSFGPKEE